jgi:hypothetical protein
MSDIHKSKIPSVADVLEANAHQYAARKGRKHKNSRLLFAVLCGGAGDKTGWQG